jgi:hypothetical protein
MTDQPKNDPWRCPQPPPKLKLEADLPAALEKLGPSPFAKNRFPFLGFLATVYDHVAAQAKQRNPDPNCE